MATVYVKDGLYWIAWGSGKDRVQKSTGLPLEMKAQALVLKEKVEAEQEARRRLLENPGRAPRTFRAFADFFVKQRELKGKSTWKKERNWLRHVMPHLGNLAMEDVDVRAIEDALLKVRKSKLAPRSVRHVGSTLSLLFKSALRERVIRANPYVLETGVLPPKRDKNPKWRATAVFTHEEVERLISDTLIPEDRRVYYALVFLLGLRLGEASDRRWEDWDETLKPLGGLLVHSSYSTEEKRSKETKTGVTRQVPVHPTLQAILARWRDGGGAEALLGRPPKPGDIICPRVDDGTQRTASVVWKRCKEDLAALGLRHRRVHDGRRTFLSLAVADGADEYRLKKLTHPSPKDAADGYISIPWRTFCQDVACLQVRGVVIATPQLRSEDNGEGNHA